MPMFGGKHFSNPAVGRSHEPEMDGGMEGESKGTAKSYHVHQHEDGSAHSHIHHADDSHEHTDHASHEEAHDHVAKAFGGEETPQEEGMEGEPKQKMSMHNVGRESGGAF